MTLIVLSIIVAVGARPEPLPTLSHPFVPDDGHLEVLGPSSTVETAVGSAAPLGLSGPPAFVLAVHDAADLQKPLARMTFTDVSGQSSWLIGLGDDGLRLLAAEIGKYSVAYPAGTVLVPHDPQPGQRVDVEDAQATVVDESGRYGTVEFAYHLSVAEPVDPDLKRAGCVALSREEIFSGSPTRHDETWCPGRGFVSATTHETRIAPRVLPKTAPAWNPDAWTSSEQSFLHRATNLRFMIATRGGVAGVDEVADDLVMISTDGRMVQMHPGGTITTASRFGELFVVTTTQRIVGYRADGLRAWDYTASAPAIRSPAVVAGTVAFIEDGDTMTGLDAASGESAWQFEAPDQIVSKPVACGDLVVFGVASGELVALRNGEMVWEVDEGSAPEVITCAGDRVVVIQGAYLDSVSLSGERLQRRAYRSISVEDAAVIDQTIVLASAKGIMGFDLDLHQVWYVPRWVENWTWGARHVAVISSDKLQLVGADGKVVWEHSATEANLSEIVPMGDGLAWLDDKAEGLLFR